MMKVLAGLALALVAVHAAASEVSPPSLPPQVDQDADTDLGAAFLAAKQAAAFALAVELATAQAAAPEAGEEVNMEMKAELQDLFAAPRPTHSAAFGAAAERLRKPVLVGGDLDEEMRMKVAEVAAAQAAAPTQSYLQRIMTGAVDPLSVTEGALLAIGLFGVLSLLLFALELRKRRANGQPVVLCPSGPVFFSLGGRTEQTESVAAAAVAAAASMIGPKAALPTWKWKRHTEDEAADPPEAENPLEVPSVPATVSVVRLA